MPKIELFSPETLQLIEEKIDYIFSDKALLQKAFIHRSFFNENKELAKEHNERLEFLGDAVLGLLISKYLFENMPGCEEGVLSSLRSRLVDASSCALYTTTLELGDYVLLGKGEKMNDGRGRESIYADLFEAIIGALFLDGGFDIAQSFYLKKCLPMAEKLIKEPSRNYKAELQEAIQRDFKQAPVYKVVRELGPDHNKQFAVAVFLEEKLLGEGEGSSKKQAEQNAAKIALENLEAK